MSPFPKSYRTFLYKYHREGFDHFYKHFENSLKMPSKALMGIDEIFKQRPNSFRSLQVFFNSKRDEAINV